MTSEVPCSDDSCQAPSPIFIAARAGNSETVSVLLQSGVDLEQLNGDLEDPLDVALDEAYKHPVGHPRREQYKRVVRVLLQGGIDLNFNGDVGYKKLAHAVENDDEDTAALLVQYGADA